MPSILLRSFLLMPLLLLLPASAGADEANHASALVATAVILRERIADTVTAYGTVQPDPAKMQTVSAPHDAVITAVFVRLGQRLKAGDKLLSIANTAAITQQLTQAQTALDFARRDLARTQGMFKNQMATRDQMAQAEKALQDAQGQLRQLTSAGVASGAQTLTAAQGGTVGDVTAKPGDVVQQGASLLTLGGQTSLVVRLGVQPAQAAHILPGAAVILTSPLDASLQISTQLASVDGAVDPSSHLVDALALIPPESTHGLIAGTILTGRIALPPVNAIVIPHAALIEDENGTGVFVVTNGIAHKVAIKVLFENDREAAIASGPAAGDRIVIAGDAGLDDGMAVREAAATVQATPPDTRGGAE